MELFGDMTQLDCGHYEGRVKLGECAAELATQVFVWSFCGAFSGIRTRMWSVGANVGNWRRARGDDKVRRGRMR